MKTHIIAALMVAAALTVSCNNTYVQPEYPKGKPATLIGQNLLNNSGQVATIFEDWTKQVTDGLSVTFVHYLGVDGMPMRVWFLVADLRTAGLTVEQCINNDVWTPKPEILSSMATRHSDDTQCVWAACNSDFGSTATVTCGPFIHDGKVYKDDFNDRNRAQCFFYMGADNVVHMEDMSEIGNVIGKVSGIDELCGGGPLLVADGVKQIIPEQPNDLSARHPRTAIGIDAEGLTVTMMVADGRRYTWSNGYQFPAMSDVMASIGCYNAMNLDGGGSSEMITRSGNSFEILNWPYDNGGMERELYASILFVTKK